MKPVSPHTTYTLSTKQLAEEFLNRNLNRNMYTILTESIRALRADTKSIIGHKQVIS